MDVCVCFENLSVNRIYRASFGAGTARDAQIRVDEIALVTRFDCIYRANAFAAAAVDAIFVDGICHDCTSNDWGISPVLFIVASLAQKCKRNFGLLQIEQQRH